MPRLRLGFCRHFVWAVITLVSLLSILEVGWRITLLCQDEPAAPIADLPLVPSRLTWQQLEPLTVLSLEHPDSDGVLSVPLNSLGLRGPEPEIPKPPGTLRIVCLGDEATFGPGVKDEETFSHHLAELLATYVGYDIEVVNAGVPGYCPLLSFLQYRHALLTLDPDVVLLTFDMSDVADDFACRPFTRLDEFGLPLACRHPSLDAGEASKALEENFVSVRWLKQKVKAWQSDGAPGGQDDIDRPAGKYAWTRDAPPDWSAYIANSLEPVAQLKQLHDPNNRPLILLSACPCPWQVCADATSCPDIRKRYGIPQGTQYQNREPFHALARFAEQHDIGFLDASLAFQQAGNAEGLYFTTAPWLTPRGHRLYAGVIASWLAPRLTPGWSPAAPPDPAPLAADGLLQEGTRPIY